MAALGPPPAGMKVLFAARDKTLLSELASIFKLDLHDTPLLITSDGRTTMIVVAPLLGGSGLLLRLTHREDGYIAVLPAILMPASQQTAICGEGFAGAVDSLLLRRCLQAGGVQ